MDICTRDSVFEEYQNILSGCVRRNLNLILDLQLEIDDVVQDLSIRLYRAIERFNDNRCPSLPAFLYRELQYEILDMRRRNKPHGIVGVPKDARPSFVYLDQPREDGLFFELPTEDDLEIYVKSIVEMLPAEEYAVVMRKMHGEPVRKKVERQSLARAREMLADYFAEREYEYA